MEYKFVSLIKDKTLSSKTVEDKNAYAIQKKTCMYIFLPTSMITSELQKLPKLNDSKEDSQGTDKLVEIVSKIDAKPKGQWVAAIYFKTEKNEVFPRLYFEPDFFLGINDNFFKAVLLLEGTLTLEGSTSSALKSKRFYKSYNFISQASSKPFTSPYPLEPIQPLQKCRWILQSFSLSIGWKDEMMSGILKLSAGHFLHCLFEVEESQPKDFKLVAGNGSEISCHGIVLAAQSPTFKAMVNPTGAMKENDSQRIEMKAFSEQTLKTFVRYIYCQKVPLKEMECNTALELFRLGHMYLIRDLTENLSKMMLTKNETWWSPNCILELYFLVRNLNVFPELTDHAVEIILKMPEDDLRQCERYKELDSKEVTELLWIFLRKLKTG